MKILCNPLKAGRQLIDLVSERVYTSQAQKPAPTCGLCGRKLGVGFYFTCHVCGRSYCYAHIPVKCTHNASQYLKQVLPARIKR